MIINVITTLLVIAGHPVHGKLEAVRPDFMHEDKDYWMMEGKEDIKQTLLKQDNNGKAKNVIFFLGDGMGPSTVTAARIHAGQKLGLLGEEHLLSFEKFPDLALVKTYNVDKQVPDSAGTATAYLTGVKGRYGTVGLDVSVPLDVCRPDLGTKPFTESILKWAQDSGKDTGFVTTTRVTHATPSGLYAHSANRDWECDTELPEKYKDEALCKDIARQLIENEPGRNIKVVLGGGRSAFNPTTNGVKRTWPCHRSDGRDLVEAWRQDKKRQGKTASFAANKQELDTINIEETDYIMGLFTEDHFPFNTERNVETVPSLEQMTELAIRSLQKADKGFFLLVEGGLIDWAHHENLALKALEEAVQLDKAVQAAIRLTNSQDTLILVTADHSHTFNINGNPPRGNPITGIAYTGSNGYNFTTLSYSTGPGFWTNVNNQTNDISRPWTDTETLNIHDKNYRQVAHTPTRIARHGGEDVAVYAQGPMSRMFRGVHDQSYVAHAIAFSACIGPYAKDCYVPDRSNATILSAPSITASILFSILLNRLIITMISH